MSEKAVLRQSDAERIVNDSEELSDDVRQKPDLITLRDARRKREARHKQAIQRPENSDDDTPEVLTHDA